MEALHFPNINELEALIRLVEDPDPGIYDQVRLELVGRGKEIIPVLESTDSHDFEHDQKIRSIIKEIRFNEIKNELMKWRESSNRDLLRGSLIISKFQYPHIENKKVEEELERIKQKVWLEINEDNTAFEIVKIFNHVLFDHCGFKSSKTNFYSPQNSYINTVLESKVGNPLSLSILYSVIAQKLQIPIYGVNLPNHFVLGFLDEFQTLKMLGLSADRNILFYINPFSKGRIFDHNEIENYLRSLNLPLQKDYFEPCSNSDILKRMITNLSYAYGKEGETEKVRQLKELQEILV
ncbi:MAG: transglutaminase-like domain-containing protein [Flavobacteriales bacterium]|nr:transglutaminase-like domain-containing protein [Flavobacteriales bacterium]